MKRFIWIFAIIALITSCKSQQFTMHDAGCTVIHDSVSVTYRPGTIQSLTDSTDFTDSAPTCGGAIKKEQIPQKVRVDTLIVERWHTEIVESQKKKVESQKKKVESSKPDKPIPRFYKDCTWGFFILLLLIVGRTALRILKAVCLRR